MSPDNCTDCCSLMLFMLRLHAGTTSTVSPRMTGISTGKISSPRYALLPKRYHQAMAGPIQLPRALNKQGMVPGLDKMVVPGQGIGDPLLFHDCKGDAICKAPRFIEPVLIDIPTFRP